MSINLKEIEENAHNAGVLTEYVRINMHQTEESLCRMFGIDPKYYKENVKKSKDFKEIDIAVVFKMFYFSKTVSESSFYVNHVKVSATELCNLCNEAIVEYMNRENDNDYQPSKNRNRIPIENE